MRIAWTVLFFVLSCTSSKSDKPPAPAPTPTAVEEDPAEAPSEPAQPPKPEKVVFAMAGPGGAVLSADGRRAATCGVEGGAVFDSATGEKLHEVSPGYCESFHISADGKYVVTGGEGVSLIDVDKGVDHYRGRDSEEGSMSIAVAADGTAAVGCAYCDPEFLELYKPGTLPTDDDEGKKPYWQMEEGVQPDSLWLRPDGNSIVYVRNGGHLRILDMKSKKTKRVKIPEDPLHVILSPDANQVALAYEDGIVVVDLAAGKKSKKYAVGSDWMRFGPDGKLYATSKEGIVELRDGAAHAVVAVSDALMDAHLIDGKWVALLRKDDTLWVTTLGAE